MPDAGVAKLLAQLKRQADCSYAIEAGADKRATTANNCYGHRLQEQIDVF